jgi:hypothetical protein
VVRYLVLYCTVVQRPEQLGSNRNCCNAGAMLDRSDTHDLLSFTPQKKLRFSSNSSSRNVFVSEHAMMSMSASGILDD